jgi:hypothetical protein
MDHERLVRSAAGGDVRAFVELTKRFQHFALRLGAVALHDFEPRTWLRRLSFGVDRAGEASRPIQSD